LSACQDLCVNTANCAGLDWAPLRFTRCLLHGPWSGRWRIGDVPDVTHYNLTREAKFCGSSYDILILLSVFLSE